MPPSKASVKNLTQIIVEWYFAKWSASATNGTTNHASIQRQAQQQRALLALLDEDPTLAGVKIGSETFYDDDSFYMLEHSSAYALTYLIHFGCQDLQVLQTVYNMYPNAVRQVQSIGWNTNPGHPIYLASTKRPLPIDVIVFLAQAFPEAVQHHVHQVMRPSTLALFDALPPDQNGHGSLAPLQVIQTLVECYPDSASDRIEGTLLLEELIQHGYDANALEFCLSKLSKREDTLTVKGDTCCTRSHVIQRVLQAVLPQLKHLSLVPRYTSPDGFVRLLKELVKDNNHDNDNAESCSKLERLELAIPTANTYPCHGTLRNLLRTIVSSSSLPNLTHISLLPARPLPGPRQTSANEEMCNDLVLQDIASSLQARETPVQSLKLSHVQVSDVGRLAKFLASCQVPRVALHHFTLDPHVWDTAVFYSTTNRSSMQHFELVQCRFASANCLCRMMGDFSKFLPRLHTLSIIDSSFGPENLIEEGTTARVDITQPILTLFSKQQLKDLRLVNENWGCFVEDMSAICRALLEKNNVTLQTLHLTVDLTNDPQGRALLLQVVQNCTSLQEVVVYKFQTCFTKKGYTIPGPFDTTMRYGMSTFDEEYVSTMEYYLNLNRFGRAQVRGGNISKAQFVGLLDTANQTLEDESLDLFNVIYGLWREASNLWS